VFSLKGGVAVVIGAPQQFFAAIQMFVQVQGAFFAVRFAAFALVNFCYKKFHKVTHKKKLKIQKTFKPFVWVSMVKVNIFALL